MEDLIPHLNHFVPMTPEILSDLAPILKDRIYRANTKILALGQINRDVCFIKRGLIIISKNVDGEIRPIWILKEGDIFIAPDSFFDQTPSDVEITSLEVTEVVGISFEEHEWMCQKHHAFLLLRDAVKTKYYKISNQWTTDMLTLTPAQRYDKLLKESPELFQRVPLKILRAYLCMSGSMWDRIRREHKSVQT